MPLIKQKTLELSETSLEAPVQSSSGRFPHHREHQYICDWVAN